MTTNFLAVDWNCKEICGYFFPKHTSKSLHFARLHLAIQVEKVIFMFADYYYPPKTGV
jgi:hypothetical protein